MGSFRHGQRQFPPALRILGLAPLGIFIFHVHYHASRGNWGETLWMCIMSNLLLGLGLLLGWPGLVRLGVIWLIPGLPLWIMDTIRVGWVTVISVCTHVVAPMVGLAALRRIGAARNTWLHAFLWFLLLQELARLFTPQELNVNVAHTMYPGWERVFGAYWQYWLFISSGSAVMLWVVNRALLWFAPPCQDAEALDTPPANSEDLKIQSSNAIPTISTHSSTSSQVSNQSGSSR